MKQSKSPDTVELLREHLSNTDKHLFELLRKRTELLVRLGMVKMTKGGSITNSNQDIKKFLEFEKNAAMYGIDPELAAAFYALLNRFSVMPQRKPSQYAEQLALRAFKGKTKKILKEQLQKDLLKRKKDQKAEQNKIANRRPLDRKGK